MHDVLRSRAMETRRTLNAPAIQDRFTLAR
jgi:hypothetical protein